jgi:uncharacterized membrane protein
MGVFVCVVLALGAGTAWFFGGLAGSMYGFPHESESQAYGAVGGVWGAITGLIAAAIWCWRMIAKARRTAATGLAWSGAILGLGVGVLATVLLHLLLMYWSERPNAILPAIGLLFGVVSGLIVGAICGALLRWFAPAATPPPETPPAVPTGEDEAG